MNTAADRHLLFGLLALQNGLVNQSQLVLAFHAWTLDKSRGLADHLEARGDLSGARRALLEGLAEVHLEAHAGDVGRSLAAVSVGKSTRESLAGLDDPDLEATLDRTASGPGSTEAGDADRTRSYAVGTATSEGQRFRVLRPHARGGLGAVFVALDSELNREVALKQILDRHADDPTSRQRFLLEAQVNGGLEHPGIVPVYGLGTYDGGRPYYAMRFIRGDSLKVALERFHADGSLKKDPGARSLELRKLLRRFMDVCNAIDYAHSRGVLHRDIKPGNIIVGKHGETLVVDWGLAKATGEAEPRAGERILMPGSASGSAETLPGSAMGTPAYMSPEQARGDLELLGRRSDVYSLGATLYCLLTGKPPQEGDDVGEVLRKVQRAEFPPPRRLDPSIDPALEAICLKAMALEPEDRYATPRLLSDDIERWTADEPVTAWREPVSRRVMRWLTRHRTGVTAAGVALLVALAGTGSVLAVQTRANQALKWSNTELAIANRKVTKANVDLKAAGERERQRFDLAMEAIKLFHGEVSEDLLLKEKEFAGLRSRLLKGAAGFYGKLERLLEGRSDASSRAALGGAYFELAALTRQIGTNDEALAVHRKALALRRELAARPGAEPEAVLEVVRSLLDMAVPLAARGDKAGAQATHAEARRLVEGLVAADRGGDEARALLAKALTDAVTNMADPRDELETARRARAICEELVARHPEVPRYAEQLGASHLAIGYVFYRMGRPADVIAATVDATAIYRRLAAARPDVYRFGDTLAKLYSNLAGGQADLGRLDEAVVSERQAVAIWRKEAEANPALTSVGNNLIFGLNELASELLDNGRPAEALERLAEARRMIRKMLAVDPGSSISRVHLPNNHLITGKVLARMGRRREARESFEEAISIWQRRVEEDPSNSLHRRWLTGSLGGFGWSYCKAGWTAEAVPACVQATAIQQALVDAQPSDRSNRDGLAGWETKSATALLAQGRPSEALACCDRARSLREDLLKGDPGNGPYARGLAETLLRSGGARAAAGDATGAAADWRRAAGLYAAHPPGRGEPVIFWACCHGALSGLAGVSEPAAHAVKAMAILRRVEVGGYRDVDLLRVEPGLDPLRTRDDFRLLMMDLAMPAEPFAAAR